MVEIRPGAGRRRGRIAGMQALYRREVVGEEMVSVREDLAANPRIPDASKEYALELLDGIESHGDVVDAALNAALTRWDLKRVAVVDRCVLRIGALELLFRPEIPTRVILDEAIEIAKQFGSAESGRFVNGVLDRVARDCKRDEDA